LGSTFASHPLIEDGDEKTTELFGADRSFSDESAALGVKGPIGVGG
jgi:hypothetical protein